VATGEAAGHAHVLVDGGARRWIGTVGVTRFLAVVPTGESVPLAVGPVRAAVAATDTASREDHGSEAVGADVVVPVPPEVHVRVTAAGSGPARQAWLERLAHELREAGVTGAVRRPRRRSAAEATLQAWLTARPVCTLLGARQTAPPGALFTPVLDVVDRPAGTAWLGLADAGFAQPDDEGLGLLLEQLVGDHGYVEARLEPRAGEATHLAWTGPPRCSLRRYGHAGDWRADVEQARRLLEARAGELAVGLVRRDSCGVDWVDLHQGDPEPPAGPAALAWQWSPELWPQLVPDAHGLQLLTRNHLDSAHDMSDWSVHAVDDRYLVESRDLDAWFAGDRVTAEVLAAARADFGAVIATADQLAAHRAASRNR
jgi:hypothetical protein